MDDGAPALEVGFAIDTGGSFSELERLQEVMNSTEARVLKSANQVEAATRGMVNIGPATAQFTSFGNAATRELQNAARESAKVEKAGEAMIRSLDRQASTFGKTASEIRAMKAETAALAAEQQGLTDLAGRIRAAEQGIYDAEFAAMRRATQEAEAAAEAKQQAAAQAAAAAEREAQAIREASFAYNQFEAAARRGMAALREAEATEAAAAREMQAMATAAERLRAQLDPAVAAQQRFDREMGNARTLIGANAITLDEYCAKLRMEQQELNAVNAGHAGGAKGANAMRFAMTGLSYQVQDTFTQLSMGANALQVVAIQGGQAAGQFANVEGKAGAVARFMIGPWGLAMTAAALVLGPLISKMLNMGSAADEALDKLRKDADQTETTRVAKEQFGRTVEGVTAALREQAEALKQVEAGLYSAAEQANINAHNERDRAAALRDSTKAMLEQQRAQVQAEVDAMRVRASGPGQRGENATLGLDAATNRLALIDAQIAKTEAAALIAERQYQGSRVALFDETAKKLATAEGRINKIYDDQRVAANKRAYDLARNGGVVTTALTAELLKIEENRQAALKAEADRQAALKSTSTEIGRNITLLEARRIAESVGGRVTSGARSTSEQAALYARYRAGTGSLAAKPGSSYHEIGQALDVAKTEGVTLKKLVDAYRKAGVKVVEALDEGNHFHIAWKKVGDAAKEQTEAENEAKKLVAIAKEQAKAASDYADAQTDAAAKFGMSAKELRLYADAAAIAKAPTNALKDAIRAAADAREAAFAKGAGEEFDKNILQPLRDELALYGLVGPARAAAALELEKSSFVTKNAASSDPMDISDAISRWMQYKALKEQIIGKDDAVEREAERVRRLADEFDRMLDSVDRVGDGMARAFGRSGEAVRDLLRTYTDYASKRHRIEDQVNKGEITQTVAARRLGAARAEATGQAIDGIKSLFAEHSKAYKVMQAIEQAYAAFQAAETIASIARDLLKTTSTVANSATRTTANTAEGASKIFADLGPWAFPVVAAMVAVIAALGFRGHGGGAVATPTSSEDLQKAAGTGTVLGSRNDKSESIARSLDEVAKNTDAAWGINTQMLSSLRSIDASIGAMAATVARSINVSGGIGDTSKLGIGSSGSAGFLGLFSSSTTRTLYDAGITLAATTVGNIVANGIAGSTYQIVQQVKKSSGFLGIGGGTKTTYQTTSGALPSDITASIRSVIGALENGIVTAAGAIGINGAKAMLDNFTVSIGQLSFNGLDAQGIEDQLNAVFSSVGDQMVSSILPGIAKFQKVGEGLFETLERVASTVGAVDAVMQKLGRTSTTLGIDVDMGIASMFDSVSDFTSAANSYFETYYSSAEQTAAKSAQLTKAFGSLNLAMPDTLAAFRALVDAQDLTTAAGQATYATLLQLAPAFADLKSAMDGAKSSADILSERADLQRQMLELQGNTAAIRALDLAKVDPSNRGLQQQIYDLQDAQAAAKAAQDLADAWKSVGNSIMDEVKRIRGLTNPGSDTFASLLGQFNAANTAARGGDQDAAKSLPGLSQALLTAAAAVATSQQELRRIQAQTAASLETTANAISGMTGSSTTATPSATVDKLLDAISTSQATAPAAANDDLGSKVDVLIAAVDQMRSENNSGHAANANQNKRTADVLTRAAESVGGDVIGTRAA